MNRIKIKSYAKINLGLDVFAPQNGFHQIESVVCSVDIYDLIVLDKRKDKNINITMKGQNSEFIPQEKNVAYLCAQKFINAFNCNGVDITVYKNIPQGAGLGGSSADGAGVLRGLKTLYNISDEEKIYEIASNCGSDIVYMMQGGFAKLSGKGDFVEKLETMLKLNFFLVLPNTAVSTKECYDKFDELNIKTQYSSRNIASAVSNNDFNGVCENLHNDLYLPAESLNSDVKQALEEIKEFCPDGFSMTGSGSCCFGIFKDFEMCDYAKSRYKGKFKTYAVSSYKEIKNILKNPFILQ